MTPIKRYLNFKTAGCRVASLLGVFVALFPAPTSAEWSLVGFANDAISGMFLTVLGLFLSFLGKLLILFVGIFQWLVDLQKDAFDFPVLRILWTTFRDFANMFFILALVFTAFAAILDLKQYQWQKLLVRVIIAAFMINFSFAICLFVIDISHTVTQIASNLIGNDIGGNIGAALQLNKINPQAIGQEAVSAGSASVSAVNGIANTVISSIFMTILVGIAAVSLITASGFLFVRIPYLWVYIIFSPLAWTAAIFNKTTYDNWRRDFVAWAFFLPYYMFMLFFGLLLISKRADIESALHLANPGNVIDGFKFAFQDIFFYVLAIGVLLWGLRAAKKASFATGTAAQTYMDKISGAVNTWAKNKTYINAMQKGWSQKVANIKDKGFQNKTLNKWVYGGERSEKLREAGVAGADWFNKLTPGERIAARGARGRLEDKYRKEDIDYAYKMVDEDKANLSKVKLEERIQKASGLEYLALAKMRAEKGWVPKGEQGMNEVKRAMAEADANSAFTREYLSTLDKNNFTDVFDSIGEMENAVNDKDTPAKLKKALLKNMAKNGRIISQEMFKQLLQESINDSKEDKDKIEESLKKNIKNIARSKKGRRDMLADPNTDKEIKRLLAEKMATDDEINSSAAYALALKVFGGENDPRSIDLRANIAKKNPLLNTQITTDEVTDKLARGVPLEDIHPEDRRYTRENYLSNLATAIQKASPEALANADLKDFWQNDDFKTLMQERVTELEGKDGTKANAEGTFFKAGAGYKFIERIEKELEKSPDPEKQKELDKLKPKAQIVQFNPAGGGQSGGSGQSGQGQPGQGGGNPPPPESPRRPIGFRPTGGTPGTPPPNSTSTANPNNTINLRDENS